MDYSIRVGSMTGEHKEIARTSRRDLVPVILEKLRSVEIPSLAQLSSLKLREGFRYDTMTNNGVSVFRVARTAAGMEDELSDNMIKALKEEK